MIIVHAILMAIAILLSKFKFKINLKEIICTLSLFFPLLFQFYQEVPIVIVATTFLTFILFLKEKLSLSTFLVFSVLGVLVALDVFGVDITLVQIFSLLLDNLTRRKDQILLILFAGCSVFANQYIYLLTIFAVIYLAIDEDIDRYSVALLLSSSAISDINYNKELFFAAIIILVLSIYFFLNLKNIRTYVYGVVLLFLFFLGFEINYLFISLLIIHYSLIDSLERNKEYLTRINVYDFVSVFSDKNRELNPVFLIFMLLVGMTIKHKIAFICIIVALFIKVSSPRDITDKKYVNGLLAGVILSFLYMIPVNDDLFLYGFYNIPKLTSLNHWGHIFLYILYLVIVEVIANKQFVSIQKFIEKMNLQSVLRHKLMQAQVADFLPYNQVRNHTKIEENKVINFDWAFVQKLFVFSFLLLVTLKMVLNL